MARRVHGVGPVTIADLVALAERLGWEAQARGRPELAQVHWAWMHRLQTLLDD